MQDKQDPLDQLELPKTDLRSIAQNFGPGLILMMTGIGTSHLVTAPAAGGRFEYALLWCLPVAYIFKYSERPGTSAAEELEDDVPEEVKRERNQVLLGIQKSISLEANEESIGQETEVLVEGLSKKDKKRWSGRNRKHQIVVFPSQGDEDLEGELVTVKVREVTPVVLVGERPGEGA